MGLQFAVVAPPVVGDVDIDHEVVEVTEIGANSVTLSDKLDGFAGGEVANPLYVANDGDLIVGAISTIAKNGQVTKTPFSIKLVDNLAPKASDEPTLKVIARTP